ncbi:MAG: DedA family protein [Acidobacteria bacterium]|nr:DedA family protein [Acidobacteriota bacterium]
MFVDTVLAWITQYGCVAIFSLLVFGIVGLPVPDETLLTFTGFLIFKGKLSLWGAFLAAFGGSVCGITISFLLGRWLGLKIFHRYGKYLHLTETRLYRVHYWFERVGKFALTIGYYIPGVRHFTAYVAGSAELEYPVFAAYAYSGAFLWVTSFFALGYFFGERWQQLLEVVHHNLVHVAQAAGAMVLLYLGWWYWRKGRA